MEWDGQLERVWRRWERQPAGRCLLYPENTCLHLCRRWTALTIPESCNVVVPCMADRTRSADHILLHLILVMLCVMMHMLRRPAAIRSWTSYASCLQL